MITYSAINQADFFGIGILTQGDGTSTVFKFNATTSPFLINYQGTMPNSYHVDVGQEGITATAAVSHVTDVGDIITVTFSTPPPSDELTNINISSIYNSLP